MNKDSTLIKCTGSANAPSLALLVSQFEKEFPTEEDCLTELFRIAGINIQCRFCLCENLQVYENRRVAYCSNCWKETWFTAGTFLEHMKKPKARLAAIWLFSRGAILKSTTFSALLDVVQSTAHDILKWARFVIQSNLPEDADLVH